MRLLGWERVAWLRRREIIRLRKVLKFYENKANYDGGDNQDESLIEKDQGDIAR